jgi:hypothetical protein
MVRVRKLRRKERREVRAIPMVIIVCQPFPLKLFKAIFFNTANIQL